MSTRTKLFLMQPWVGSVNTTLDPSVIGANELTRGENIVFGVRGSRKKRDGINYNWDSATTGAVSMIGQADYWFGNAPKTQIRIALGDNKVLYQYNSSGTRTAITDSGTAWSSAITTSSIEIMNNTAIVAVDGSGNVMKKWKGSGNVQNLGTNTTTGNTNTSTTITNVPGSAIISRGAAITGTDIPANTTVVDYTATTIILSQAATGTTVGVTFTLVVTPPVASICREHIGRLWTNDKTNSDRIQYSTTGNPEEWGGLGDSGAIDIGVGDGDPAGITAIFPTFKKVLFIAKQTKLYRLDGTNPEEFEITLVSDGIGCVSHNAVCAEDQSDVFFISEKGIHSLSATQEYGDFENTYASKDIQKTFNEKWTKSRLQYSFGGYLNHINSIVFAVTDETYGTGSNNALWLYNVPLKSWYNWPNVSCQSLVVTTDSDKKRLYLGTNTSRIAKTFAGTNYDTSTAGISTAVQMVIQTGLIYFDQNPYIVNGFKKFALIYGPKGSHTITVSITIDNYSAQALAFSQASSAAALGVSFVLGTSVLGYNYVTGPYIQSIDGYGRGVQVTFQQSGISEEAEIQGFAIEYEPLGTAQETILSG